MAKRKKPTTENRFRTPADAAGDTLNDAGVVTPPAASAQRTPGKTRGRTTTAAANTPPAPSTPSAASTPPPAQRTTVESEGVTSGTEPIMPAPRAVQAAEPSAPAIAAASGVDSTPEPVSPELQPTHAPELTAPATEAAAPVLESAPEPASTISEAAHSMPEPSFSVAEAAAPENDHSEYADPGDPRDLIAARAYELYEGRGGSHGADVEDWLEAERQIDHRSSDRPSDD